MNLFQINFISGYIDPDLGKIGYLTITKTGYSLGKKGISIEITIPPPTPLDLQPEKIPLDILYEDNVEMVINKPAGMVMHPAVGHTKGTLVHAALGHTSFPEGIGGKMRPGIVHRLDKNTSGLMVAAKNDFAHLDLSRQIQEHQVTKKYITLVHGNLKDDSGIIDAPIGRSLKNRKKMAVTVEGKSREAITYFKVLKRFSGYTLVEATLRTGRTHQIRVHLAFIGHPIVGDQLYGRKRQGLNIHRQALHSHILGFVHPSSKKYMEFSAPLPQDMQKIINYLEEGEK